MLSSSVYVGLNYYESQRSKKRNSKPMKYIFAVAGLLWTNLLCAQTLTLSGILLDSADQTPLPSATVILTQADGQEALATTTNQAGQFKFEKLKFFCCFVKSPSRMNKNSKYLKFVVIS